MKIPEEKGLWPAVWMLPVSHKSKPEIDVMEILGHEPNTVHMNLHYLKADGRRGREGKTWSGVDFSEGWHTFAVDWQPEAIIWYVDGVERWRYTDVSHIPQERMYLLANLALGGDWAGAPNKKTRFPSYFEVDYIRVWQRSEQTLCGGMLPREPY